MNIVFIVPTGVGAEIGGHAGDANPALKLIASLCDNVITHPNVVNASDINEMPDNCWYVPGAMLDDFLENKIGLLKPLSNRILLVSQTITNNLTNTTNAARSTMGLDITTVEIEKPLVMTGFINEDGLADGQVEGEDALNVQLGQLLQRGVKFDAVAISSHIDVHPDLAEAYMRGETQINPWGQVEAILSRSIYNHLELPIAHAPSGDVLVDFNEVVDPRRAAEMISDCYILSVLKGLKRAPRLFKNRALGDSIFSEEIDLMISPYRLFGRPHKACIKAGIPILYVRENKVATAAEVIAVFGGRVCENYLEAAGIVVAMREGLTVDSVRRRKAINEEAKNSIKKVAKELAVNDEELNAVLKETQKKLPSKVIK